MAHAQIEGVQFGILNDEQIRGMSAVRVDEFTLHARGVPKANSPADARFGASSRFQRCGLCKNTTDCPGHSGYIALPYPLPHVGYIPYLVKILNLYCFNCSGFLLRGVEYPDRFNNPEKRLAWFYDEVRRARNRKRCPLTCPDCGLPQPIIHLDEPLVVAEWYDDVVEEHFGSRKRSAPAEPVNPSSKKRRRKKPAPPESPLPEEGDVGDGGEDNGEDADAITAEQRRAEREYFVNRSFTNWDAYNVLLSIKEADLEPLGINGKRTHPAGMMMLSLVVPAMGVRPTMSFEEASRRSGYHQFTRTLADILKLRRSLLSEAAQHSIQLQNQEAADPFPEPVLTALRTLYVSVSEYLVKGKHKCTKLKLSPYAARSHARKQAVTDPLKGKEGRFRATLLGKRVNFSARSVITPAPDADVDEILIPEEIARRQTIPVRVNAINRAALQRMMTDGDVHQILDERTGDMIAVGDHNKDTLPLMDGWVVERYLRDGDIIPANRQPTLHKPSIMGHRVKVVKGQRSFGINHSVCTAYNADFDGDEMNVHIPQTLEARAESQELLHVPEHMIHPRANRPIIAPIQDTLDGGYYITRQGTLYDRGEAMQLLATLRYDPHAPATVRMGQPGADIGCPTLPPPAIVHPQPLWTGKQIVSCTLPVIDIQRRLKNRPPQYGDDPLLEADGMLLIRRGEVLRGTLCNQSLGTSSGGIIHTICIVHGNHTAARFVSDVQRMLNRSLRAEGFSVGPKDCLCSPEIQRKIQIVKDRVHEHIERLEAMGARMPDDLEVQKQLENQICATLKSMLQMVGNIIRSNMTESNRWHVMANLVGSKGSVFNVAQVMGAVGGTFVNGERPSAPGNQRVLPSAPLPGQPRLGVRQRLAAQGYIDTGYKTGLRMSQAVPHAMGGREGLVDTAAKTARTGYIQRRLGKAMEGHHIAQDGTVRNAYNSVYQLHFGGDGLDPAKTFQVRLPVLLLDDAELRERHVVELRSDDPRCHAAIASERALLVRTRDEVRHLMATEFQPRMEIEAPLPFAAAKLMLRARADTPEPHVYQDHELAELHLAVRDACQMLDSEVPCVMTCLHLLSTLSTKQIRDVWRCPPACVQAVLADAINLHRRARIQAGDAVGILTATSLGEPTTQMTLNTFHFAGVDNLGMTQGVPRMREIIGATTNIATPLITLPMRRDLPRPEVAAEVLARSLPHTVLRNVCKDPRLVYEPDVLRTTVAADAMLVESHAPFIEHVADTCSRWVIRLELSRSLAGDRSLDPRTVADLIQEELLDSALVIATTDTDPAWVIRIYVLNVEAAVDAALKRSVESGTTRAAARRSSQRPSLAASRKRKRYMDLADVSDRSAPVPVPLHLIDPAVPGRTHGLRAVVEWTVVTHMMEALRELSVGGLKGVRAAVVRTATSTHIDPDTKRLRNESEPVVDVLGTGLADAALLPPVDTTRLLSTDIIAIYETYGITAAAHALYNELCTCLASSGARVDERLIKMVVDVATHDGYVMPISRHGLNRLARHGALAKITFEETLRILFSSSVFGSYDPLLGVSENTIVGKPARLGTNLSQMYHTHDGELMPCTSGVDAGAMPTATLDTRILRSAMLAGGVDKNTGLSDDEIEEDAAICRDESLERILAVRRTHVGQIQAAGVGAVEPAEAHADLYSAKLFQMDDAASISAGLTPGSPTPFRPSSPSLEGGVLAPMSHTAVEPFRPSSPVL